MNARFLHLPQIFAILAAVLTLNVRAQVPFLINHQGRIAVDGVNFEGTGSFRFALVNATGTQTYWSNDGTSTAGSQPANAVSLPVTKGLYSVLLGDTTLTNMTAIPTLVFNNTDVRLRVWFNDGTHGSQLLAPDQRFGSVGLAMVALTVPDNAITSNKISPGAVGNNQLGAGAVNSSKLASGLTLSGTTSGTFSGSLTGNATSATTAGSTTNFSGPLAGDVTGTQGATVVSMVGGSTAASINSAIALMNAATSNNVAGAIVRRDASGTFNGSTLNLSGHLNLPASSITGGMIFAGGTRVMHEYGAGNFFAGLSAGNLTMTGANNTAIGESSLMFNTSGGSNTALGQSAMENNTTAGRNVAIGANAMAILSFNNSGNTYNSENVAVGFEALYLCQPISGGQQANTAVGAYAMRGNTNGTFNTAVGYQTLYTNNSGGSGNSALGYKALYSSSSGINNTACGIWALESMGSGSNNVALGSEAGRSFTNGSSNIFIGFGAGSAVSSGSGNIYIGSNGVQGDSNTVRIGAPTVGGTAAHIGSSSIFMPGIYGDVGNGNGTAVFVDNVGRLCTAASSRRFKEDIMDMAAASDSLLSMRPVTFHYKAQKGEGGEAVRHVPQFGLIAEEVAELDPDLVVRDKEGRIHSVRYEAINAMLLNEFLKEHRHGQKQDDEIEQLKRTNAALEKRLAKLEAKFGQRESRPEKRKLMAPAAQPRGAANAKKD